MTKDDKRKNNQRPLKYDEPKRRRCISLTDKAWAWYQLQGGNDWIELSARNQ